MPPDLANAVLESWVMHARNLIDFFYGSKQQDDIVMLDFVGEIIGSFGFPEISEELSDARRRANKEMAHLTSTRIGISPDEKQWAFGLITNQIIDRMKAFINLVNDGELRAALKSILPKEIDQKFAVKAQLNTSGLSGGEVTFQPGLKDRHNRDD